MAKVSLFVFFPHYNFSHLLERSVYLYAFHVFQQLFHLQGNGGPFLSSIE